MSSVADEVQKSPSTATTTESGLRQAGMDWYVLRVASNKEEQVRSALERKVKIEGLDQIVGRIMVPTLKERRMKGGQAKVYERKLYPGYVFVEMMTEADGSIPENVWFLIKETTGVGDFIGSEGKPSRMEEHDIAAMLAASQKADDQPTLSGMNFKKGDVVKVTEGSFENFEGTIDSVDEHRGMVTVLLTIFGRSTPVEVEYWQLEKIS
ncbi:MAG: Transcription termination/antitermination protein NusG [Phycisphaerae bacterium]|nr:Transcription termination/antitermination protein NusG [Phycisphaerae bacterium]